MLRRLAAARARMALLPMFGLGRRQGQWSSSPRVPRRLAARRRVAKTTIPPHTATHRRQQEIVSAALSAARIGPLGNTRPHRVGVTARCAWPVRRRKPVWPPFLPAPVPRPPRDGRRCAAGGDSPAASSLFGVSLAPPVAPRRLRDSVLPSPRGLGGARSSHFFHRPPARARSSAAPRPLQAPSVLRAAKIEPVFGKNAPRPLVRKRRVDAIIAPSHHGRPALRPAAPRSRGSDAGSAGAIASAGASSGDGSVHLPQVTLCFAARAISWS